MNVFGKATRCPSVESGFEPTPFPSFPGSDQDQNCKPKNWTWKPIVFPRSLVGTSLCRISSGSNPEPTRFHRVRTDDRSWKPAQTQRELAIGADRVGLEIGIPVGGDSLSRNGDRALVVASSGIASLFRQGGSRAIHSARRHVDAVPAWRFTGKSAWTGA